MNDETINKLADAFCCWPLPESVRADPCATMPNQAHRSGTNLLTITEAFQMFKEVAAPILDAETVEQIRDLELENTAAWTEVEKLKRDKKVARVLELRTDLAALTAECEELRKDRERLHWLHDCSTGVTDLEGYEWGIYRVKWNCAGQVESIYATDRNFNDLDKEMTREAAARTHAQEGGKK